MAQRRGFLSNRKADRDERKENSKVLAEINDLAAHMGNQTLGEYLAEQRGHDPQKYHRTRIRGWHTHRDMYRHEFTAIWDAQQPQHPNILTDTLREQIQDILFFQRSLLPPSPNMVGRCELEPRLPRCPKADRRAQRFRLYQEINNLRVLDTSAATDRCLTEEERKQLIKYLSGAKSRTFDQVRKHLFDQHENVRFNLERGERKKLLGMPSDAMLAHKNMLGKSWHKIDEDLKDRIVAALIDDDHDRLSYLLRQTGFDQQEATRILDEADLEDGYLSYSLHAIKQLLPYLEQGLPLASNNPEQPCALRQARYLLPWEHQPDVKPYLPDPPDITNPLVMQALHEVKKVVNAVLREHIYRPGHQLGAIHIELAREVKGSAEQRRRQAQRQRQNERRRDYAAERIRELNIKPTRLAIQKYLLWEEQNRLCVYSGTSIGITQLFGSDVEIDHILPYPRSLDNSMMNKVVCFRTENAAGPNNRGKGNKTPHEWLADADPAKYEQVLQRARCFLPNSYSKYQRFLRKQLSLDDFFNRQFVDTTYITSRVREYVACLNISVLCPKGQHTATLRHHWGLDTILSELGDSPAWEQALDLPPGEKNRLDHRHHAIDAIVVALTRQSRLQQLARINRHGGTKDTGEVLPAPENWDDFRNDVKGAIRAINVSHRPRRKISGPLHKDTIYGPVRNKAGEHIEGQYVLRKPLEALSPSEVAQIRDQAVRKKVKQRLEAYGISVGRGQDKIPKKVWSEPLWMNEKKGVPIHKVRLIRPEQSVQPIRGGKSFVKPGKLHHACIFDVGDGRNGSKYEAVYITLLEAKDRLRKGKAVVNRTHPEQSNARFVMSICPGDMLLAEFNGKRRLVTVSTLVSTQKRIHIVDAKDARPSSQKKDQGKSADSLRAEKVTVDPIGRIRTAND
jgi:CRISPR-associated endonuclease Csn1